MPSLPHASGAAHGPTAASKKRTALDGTLETVPPTHNRVTAGAPTGHSSGSKHGRSRKRSRILKKPVRVAQCLDRTGHEALLALERRLQDIRLQPGHRGSAPDASGAAHHRPHRPVQLTAINPAASKHAAEARSAESTGTVSAGPAGEDAPGTRPAVHAQRPAAPRATAGGPVARRPRFMKPLVALDNAPSVPLTPTRPNQPNPRAGPAFLSPRRPVSASMPTRRRAPSILKRRRRTKSATTRLTTVAAKDDFIPDGMIVSLPPLLPTHSLLADAYTQGYDCGVGAGSSMDGDMDCISEVDTDTELEMAIAGSLCGSDASSDRPSVAVPPNFVQDMLASLDDSLEEGGFQELLRNAQRADAAACGVPSACGGPTPSACGPPPAITAHDAAMGNSMPMTDSPTLILDALSPSAWNTGNSSLMTPGGFGGFGALPSADGGMFSFSDVPDVGASPAPDSWL